MRIYAGFGIKKMQIYILCSNFYEYQISFTCNYTNKIMIQQEADQEIVLR